MSYACAEFNVIEAWFLISHSAASLAISLSRKYVVCSVMFKYPSLNNYRNLNQKFRIKWAFKGLHLHQIEENLKYLPYGSLVGTDTLYFVDN